MIDEAGVIVTPVIARATALTVRPLVSVSTILSSPLS